MTSIKAACVYCGSSPGKSPQFMALARELGNRLATEKIGLVYGGGRLGLMGAVADGAIERDGTVTGIIPGFLREIEVDHPGVSELIVTTSMHERKEIMYKRSDAFIVLPGGLGTLEETVEMLTWGQLGRHEKPVIIVNYRDYWQPLLKLLHYMIDENFAPERSAKLWHVVETAQEAVEVLKAAPMPRTSDASLEGKL